MIKKLIISIILLLLSIRIVSASEKTVMIINQIRGSEVCCNGVQPQVLDKFITNSLFTEIPNAWAVRYDALTDNQFFEKIKKLKGEFGILLEVTPNLAKDSGVLYKGDLNGNDWYYAKNSLLVGYTQTERKKIIDHVFEIFKNRFGDYPVFTCAWMIDGWSLTYINNIYNIKLHELTKEQYETDSYTLYGGVFNSPYFPSPKFPLMPAQNTKLNMLVVRQTISDIEKNYGSSKAYYTSQPNDYLSNPEKKDIQYFSDLLYGILDQGNNFALLGLENTFTKKLYFNEFLKQLEIVKEMKNDGNIIVSLPKDYSNKFINENSSNKFNFFENKDKSIYWFFGKNYRARVVKKEDGLILDDLRVFSDISDPYFDSPVSTNYAYWIIPYLFDGSQQFTYNKDQEKKLKNLDLFYDNTFPDFLTNPYGIVLGKGEFTGVKTEDGYKIKNKKDDNEINFYNDRIEISEKINPYITPASSYFYDFYNGKESFDFNIKKHYPITLTKQEGFISIGYLINSLNHPLFSVDLSAGYYSIKPVAEIVNFKNLNPIFQPDKSDLPVNIKKSVFYWNNKSAIAGRNKIRLFLLPLNELERPVKVHKLDIKVSDANLKYNLPKDYSNAIVPWFIDFYADRKVKSQVSVIIDGQEAMVNVPVEIIEDCNRNFLKCLTSPEQGIKYILTIISELKSKWIQSIQNTIKK